MTHRSDNRAYFYKIDTTIKKIRNALQKRFVEAGIDLTVDQWVLVDHIFRENGVSQNKLGEVTYKDAPTVTRIIDILEKKGIVQRTQFPGDRRKFLLHLTSHGKSVYTKAFPVVAEIRNIGWGNLDDADYEKFVRIMDTIYNNFNF